MRKTRALEKLWLGLTTFLAETTENVVKKFFNLVLKNSSRLHYSGENLGMKII